MSKLNPPGLHLKNAEPTGEVLDTGTSRTIARPVDGSARTVFFGHTPLTREALLAAAALMLELEAAHLSGARADARRVRFVLSDGEPDAE